MDGLKLAKWKESFEKEVKTAEIEFDAFFKPGTLSDHFSIDADDTFNLHLTTAPDLPKEIETRLRQILIKTKPEDSV